MTKLSLSSFIKCNGKWSSPICFDCYEWRLIFHSFVCGNWNANAEDVIHPKTPLWRSREASKDGADEENNAEKLYSILRKWIAYDFGTIPGLCGWVIIRLVVVNGLHFLVITFNDVLCRFFVSWMEMRNCTSAGWKSAQMILNESWLCYFMVGGVNLWSLCVFIFLSDGNLSARFRTMWKAEKRAPPGIHPRMRWRSLINRTLESFVFAQPHFLLSTAMCLWMCLGIWRRAENRTSKINLEIFAFHTNILCHHQITLSSTRRMRHASVICRDDFVGNRRSFRDKDAEGTAGGHSRSCLHLLQ